LNANAGRSEKGFHFYTFTGEKGKETTAKEQTIKGWRKKKGGKKAHRGYLHARGGDRAKCKPRDSANWVGFTRNGSNETLAGRAKGKGARERTKGSKKALNEEGEAAPWRDS